MDKSFPPECRTARLLCAVDFDGVVHDDALGFYDGTCYAEPVTGAKLALQKLSERFDIVIFTAKARPGRPLVDGRTGSEIVWDWLARYEMADSVVDVTAEKPRAYMYIDNRGYRFESWVKTLGFMEKTFLI